MSCEVRPPRQACVYVSHLGMKNDDVDKKINVVYLKYHPFYPKRLKQMT